MTEDYRKMWTDLGLDLEAHDMLLGALGQGYAQTFLAQKDRPEGMKYFDFVVSEVHGLRIKELMDGKAAGRKVVGSFCVYVPEEIVLALDCINVGLCAGAEFGYAEAEKFLPRNTCSLIKSFFGFSLSRVCPYMSASDLVVGENTCDGKKKAYELFADKPLVNELYIMDLPNVRNERGRALLVEEYTKFARKMEALSGKKLTVENLKKGIARVNAKRTAMHRLALLRAADPAPISGLDALLANQVFFYDDPERFTGSVNAICDELEKRVAAGRGVARKGAPRILVSGCPMAVPNWKLHSIVEGCGAVIVGEESCVGDRGTRDLTPDGGATVDALIAGIADRYLKRHCAVFTPNGERLEDVRAMADEYKADGVIHYGIQFCTPYQIEGGLVERELEKAKIPALRIDTDYGTEDVGQIRTRVEAFLERIAG